MSPVIDNASELPDEVLEAFRKSDYPNDIEGSGIRLVIVGEGQKQISVEIVSKDDLERAKKLAKAETNFLILPKQARK